MIQPHLKVEKVQKYALLPGDPDRVGKILKFLTNEQEIKNNRGLRIAEGDHEKIKISVVTTGMGCPSAAIVTEELAKADAKVLIRLGTCGGLLKEMEPGDLIIPEYAWCADGTTKEYGYENKKIKSNEKVFGALVEAAKKLKLRYFIGTNRTHDAFYEPLENFIKLEGKNLVSSEMECSSVFLVSQLRGMMAGAVLVVNTPEPPEEVRKNPESIYKLVDENKVNDGVKNSIRVALEAIKILEKEN